MGPLVGCKVVELAGIGPGPFAAMLLADLGAEVVRVDRPGGDQTFPGPASQDVLNRSKKSVCLDLKRPEAARAVLEMIAGADILIEGYRPGVTERLGLGPDECLAHNPRLVYGRMTGWGQFGPMASQAGHDINYIAVTGALHAIGAAGGPPQVPMNLLGDFGGGAMYLTVGVLAAWHEARTSGNGQVVDAAIVDGTSHLLASVFGMLATGTWEDRRGVNMLDGGAPYYGVYETADGKHVAVGALESKFYVELVRLLGVDVDPADQYVRDTWPATHARFAEIFARCTRDEWVDVFEGTDACVAPIVSLREAATQSQVVARGSIVEHDGVLQPAPAPRFSRSETTLGPRPPKPGEHTREVLAAWQVVGVDDLLTSGVAVQG